jgi:hypothetical protein
LELLEARVLLSAAVVESPASNGDGGSNAISSDFTDCSDLPPLDSALEYSPAAEPPELGARAEPLTSNSSGGESGEEEGGVLAVHGVSRVGGVARRAAGSSFTH